MSNHGPRVSAGAAPTRDPPAILIVNDESAQLVAMEATLAASGYRIVCASSGREARQGYAMGAVDYLVAPFAAATLRAKVAVFVELFQRAREVRSLAAELEGGLVRAERLNADLTREIAQRRRAEAELAVEARRLKAAVAELESYDYSVAHDLRAPLRAIHAYASLVQQQEGDRLSAETRGYLDRVLGAATRMSELIDGLLALSRAARAEMHRSPVDLSALASRIVESLVQASPERRVEVTVEPGMTVSADPALLRVAMQNLLDNAWKFTRERDVAHIQVGSRSEADGTAYYVRDDGVGFDMTFVGQLFRTFQRLHGEEKFEGTGIGLATVRRIIERHGGRVWAEGAPDRGATFSFTLPPGPLRVGETGRTVDPYTEGASPSTSPPSPAARTSPTVSTGREEFRAT